MLMLLYLFIAALYDFCFQDSDFRCFHLFRIRSFDSELHAGGPIRTQSIRSRGVGGPIRIGVQGRFLYADRDFIMPVSQEISIENA